MYSVELVDTYEGFLKLKYLWNDTVGRSDTDYPFMTHEWFDCSLRACQQYKELLILLVKEGGQIVCIAPLMRTQGRVGALPVRLITLIGGEHRFKNSFILTKKDPAILTTIVSSVKDICSFDLFNLSMIPEESHMCAAARTSTASRGLRYFEAADDISPSIIIERSWDEFLKTRPGKFRQKLNYTARVFQKQRDYEIVQYRRESVVKAMEEMKDISRHSWKFKAGSAIVSKPKNLRFYECLAHAAAARDWLRFWLLKIGGRPAAFAYNLEYKGSTYALKIEFDEHFGALSPSEFLYTNAIRDSFERGMREYDWLGTCQPFKMKWTSFCRPHFRMLFFNDALYGSLLYFWKASIVTPLHKRFIAKSREAEGLTARRKALGKVDRETMVAEGAECTP